MDKAKTLNAILVAALAVSFAYAATQTSNLSLYKFAVGDTDYPTNQNLNMDTLDAAILDKRTGGIINGDLQITGSIVSTNTYTLSGIQVVGKRTGAELRAESCSDVCWAHNIDENAIYESTGTGVGQWRNTRTGTGP